MLWKNHSQKNLEIKAPYIQKPVIPGIECVGEIADPSDSGWRQGQKVIALMGGMGRSFDGSYAEYALLPVWLLHVRWNGKLYTFAMNGQTGKLVGDLPLSKKQYWKYVTRKFHLKK